MVNEIAKEQDLDRFDLETLNWELVEKEFRTETCYLCFKVYQEENIFGFTMKINKMSSGWYPVWISHTPPIDKCPYCKDEQSVTCKGFQGNLRELFNKIISHNTLRLRFLLGGMNDGK